MRARCWTRRHAHPERVELPFLRQERVSTGSRSAKRPATRPGQRQRARASYWAVMLVLRNQSARATRAGQKLQFFGEQQIVHIADEIVVAQVFAPRHQRLAPGISALAADKGCSQKTDDDRAAVGRSSEMTMSASRRLRCSMRGSASRSMDRCGWRCVVARQLRRQNQVPKPSVAPHAHQARGPLAMPVRRARRPSRQIPSLPPRAEELAPGLGQAVAGGLAREQGRAICFSSAWMRRATVVCSRPCAALPPPACPYGPVQESSAGCPSPWWSIAMCKFAKQSANYLFVISHTYPWPPVFAPPHQETSAMDASPPYQAPPSSC